MQLRPTLPERSKLSAARSPVHSASQRLTIVPAGALGSPGFVSPEVVHDEAHTPSMDVFSLGVVAFVMLVGRKPFSIQARLAQ